LDLTEDKTRRTHLALEICRQDKQRAKTKNKGEWSESWNLWIERWRVESRVSASEGEHSGWRTNLRNLEFAGDELYGL
jgi:hypothetical protein